MRYKKTFFPTFVVMGFLFFLFLPNGLAAEDEEMPAWVETSIPGDYSELAKSYRKKAAYYRQEVKAHRKMKEIFSKSAEKTSGSVREEWATMDEQCQGIIDLLERLASEMDILADRINNDKPV